MNNFYKHIALFLWGVFVFPIIYQPVHVVLHHMHVHTQECRGNLSNSSSSLFTRKQTSTPVYTVQNEKCPVCSYEFSINTIPENPAINSQPLPIRTWLKEGKIIQVQQTPFYKKPPRAPPV